MTTRTHKGQNCWNQNYFAQNSISKITAKLYHAQQENVVFDLEYA